LDWTIDFREIVLATYLLAAAVALVSVGMIAIVMVMRSVTTHRERARLRFEAYWIPVFYEPSLRAHLAPLGRGEAPWFMAAWNDVREGTASERGPKRTADPDVLTALARSAHVDEFALGQLASRDITRVLPAIVMLGYLGERAALTQLEEIADSVDPILSFAASRALIQIDPLRTGHFVDQMTERRDWSRFKLLASVEELRHLLESPILTKIVAAPDDVQRELLQYLRFFNPAFALPVLRALVRATGDALAITSALRVFEAIGEPADAALAATFAEHSDWRVRVQAANVLRARGSRADLPALQALLHDPQWWVRYRAAQGVTNITGFGAQLDEMIGRERDRYAVDIIEQVVSECSAALEAASL
jgi:hypothetical protein